MTGLESHARTNTPTPRDVAKDAWRPWITRKVTELVLKLRDIDNAFHECEGMPSEQEPYAAGTEHVFLLAFPLGDYVEHRS